MRRFVHLLSLLLLSIPVVAQDETIPDEAAPVDLVIESQELVTRPDIFGSPALYVEGQLTNNGRDVAYADIALTAEAYDEDDELIGEGFGYLVTTCGAGLLPSFALQPGRSQAYDVILELYEETFTAEDVDRLAVFAAGNAVEATRANPFLNYDDLIPVTDDEVVSVEWVAPDDDADEEEGWKLRYGLGCDADAFTLLDWYEYDLASAETVAITHPQAELINETVLNRLEFEDPNLYRRSFLSFHPAERRMIYQNALNTVLTAEPDGTFQRIIWDELSSYSLQGLVWLPEGRFLAYYFGAFGDPVRYFTASMAGQRISTPLETSVPSFTVPGATPDGVRVVITTAVDGVTGYYLVSTLNQSRELLFEAEVPGNNWPAPVYVPTPNGEAFIYIVRPVNGQARLECYDTTAGRLTSLTILPLELAQDDRAWTWMSPDNTVLAISANGQASGLWLADLRQLSACQPL